MTKLPSRSFLFTSFAVILSAFLFPYQVFADRPIVRVTQGGRANLRSKGTIPSEMVSRVDLEFIPEEKNWRLAPFVEARWDVDGSQWSRVELGAEAGTWLFRWNPEICSRWYMRPLSWVYVGQAFYERWFSPGVNVFSDQQHPPGKIKVLLPNAPHTESESRLVIEVPLSWTIRTRPCKLYALDEYVFDLNEGRGIRNELAAGIQIPLPLEWPAYTRLGWRHVDLIHLLDVDQFEGSVHIEF